MSEFRIQGMKQAIAVIFMLTLGFMLVSMSAMTTALAQEGNGPSFVHKGTFESQTSIVKGVFGYSSATDGDTLIVGEPASKSNSDAGIGHGFLHIYKLEGSTYTHIQTLTSDDSDIDDNFGASVSISGNTIAVSSPSHDGALPDSGAVYIYEKGTDGKFQFSKKLFEPNPNLGDFYGYSVAVNGNTLVVGSTGDGDNDNAPRECGVLYVYVRNGISWDLQAQLWPPDPVVRGFLGTWSAIVGDTIISGASGDTEKGANSGAAYVWNRTGTSWVMTQKITPDDTIAHDWFGSSIAFDGKELFIGAPGDDKDFENQGSVYVYGLKDGKWMQKQKLHAGDGNPEDRFGASIVRNGKYVVIGAPLADAAGKDSGAVYVFGRPNGDDSELRGYTKLTPIPGTEGDFGKSATITENNLISIGAPGILDYRGAIIFYAEAMSQGPPDMSRIGKPDFIGDTLNLNKPLENSTVTLGRVTDDFTPPGDIKFRIVGNPWGIGFKQVTNNNGVISANVSVSCDVFNEGAWATDKWTNEAYLYIKDSDYNARIVTLKLNITSLPDGCK